LYQDTIKNFFKLPKNSFPKFDLIVLGVGEDGHIASLFPSRQELKTKNKLVLPIPKFGRNNEERVSLTLPVINHAKNIMFVVAGKKKASVVKRVFESKNKRRDSSLPAAKVKPHNGNLIWFLDKEAAAYVV